MQHSVPPLLSFLSNDYLLIQTTPYLLPQEIYSLAATSKPFYNLLYSTRGVFRRLDLSAPGSVERTEERSQLVQYSRPIVSKVESRYQSILDRPFILRDTQTLILDGLRSIDDELSTLLLDSRCRISILSIRECPINQPRLQQLLHYLVRPGAASKPTLKGVYMFGRIDGKPRARNAWERTRELELQEGWEDTVAACEGHIAFDAALCQGPRHRTFVPLDDEADSWNPSSSSLSSSPASVSSGFSHMSFASFSTAGTSYELTSEGSLENLSPMIPSAPPKLALVTLSKSCDVCHAPKPTFGAPTILYPPPPLHSSSLKVASRPPLHIRDCHERCEECVKDRACQECGKWWCENCYDIESARISGIQKVG